MSKDGGIRVVCFDLGGVLVRLVRDGWVGACAAAGVSIDVDDPAVWGRHAELLKRYELGEVDDATYEAGIAACLPGVDCRAVLRAFDAWLVGEYPGARSLVAELKEREVVTACLSNTNGRHWRTMLGGADGYGVVGMLDYQLASHVLGLAKPDERIYRVAQGEMGVGGREVLFFDDRAENVEGARRAGWRAEVVTDVEDAVGQMRGVLRGYGIL